MISPQRTQRGGVRRANHKILFLVVLCVLCLSASSAVRAQAPFLDWYTLRTAHFYVNFNKNTEALARRVASGAELAYQQLSREMHPPRGMIDITISDDVDASNGSATPYPTNRIVIYASPPVSESALRYTNDWAQMVVTHELTHIFHLDRTRGVWSLAQKVFGRAAAAFPNLYSPSWLTEGLAVYEESKLAGAGRIYGSEHRMILRSSAIDHRFPAIGSLSLAQGEFPFGESAYGYGSLFVDYLARTYGEGKVRDFVDKSAAELIPYLPDIPAKGGFGVSFSRAWREFSDSVQRTAGSNRPPITGWRELTHDGTYVLAPRWLGDSSLVYAGTPGRESFGAYRVDLNGRRQRIGRRNSVSPNVQVGPNKLLYAQADFVNPYQVRSDLWIQENGRERQITFGERLTDPDARADGEIVAKQILPGATRLVRVSRDGKSVRPITTGTFDEQWTEPRWSHRGDRIAAVRWRRGNISQIVILDSLGNELGIAASQNATQATPSWSFDDSGVYYSSDYTGSTQLYFTELGGATYRISQTATGIFEPQPGVRLPTLSPDSGDRVGSLTPGWLAAVDFRSDGYHLGVAPCCEPAAWQTDATAPVMTSSYNIVIRPDTSTATKYSAWRTFRPRYWIPTLAQGIRGGYRFGAQTSGFDVVGRHSMSASIAFPLNGVGGIVGDAWYQYSGLGLPILQADVSQDWVSLGTAYRRDAARTPIGEVFRRTQTAEALATWLRSRARSSLSFTGGFAVEHRTHALDSDIPLTSFDTSGALGSPTYPSAIVAGTYTRVQRPVFSISPEDGFTLGFTVRDRFNSGANGRGGASISTVATSTIYKSLDFPGFAHHVIALRGAGGWADERAAGYYLVGGVSGVPFQIVPGYTLGEGRQTFPVRGFESGTLAGTRAFAGSAEYRLPLWMIGRSPGILPFFFDRSSLTFFGDYGVAWCPDIASNRQVCNQVSSVLTEKIAIASVGAEANLTLGILSWDSPTRFRLGVVRPIQNRLFFKRAAVQVYLVSGLSF